MFNLGAPELAVILVLALLVFGPKKLPEIGRGVGQAMREFKRASRDLMDSFNEAMEERPHPAPVTEAYTSPSANPDSVYPYQPAGEAPAHEPVPAPGETHGAGEAVPAAPAHDSHAGTSSAIVEPSIAKADPPTGSATAEPHPATAHAPERNT